jgi:hypothetical protein
MSEHGELSLTLDDHRRAFTEVSFLLEMLVRTAGDVVGKSTPSLGTNAGRQMARKLPIVLNEPTLAQVQEAVARSLAAGFEIAGQCGEDSTDLRIGRCAVRSVCRDRGLELNGELCRMFHYTLAGIMAQLLGKPIRPGAVTANEVCTVHLDAQR